MSKDIEIDRAALVEHHHKLQDAAAQLHTNRPSGDLGLALPEHVTGHAGVSAALDALNDKLTRSSHGLADQAAQVAETMRDTLASYDATEQDNQRGLGGHDE